MFYSGLKVLTVKVIIKKLPYALAFLRCLLYMSWLFASMSWLFVIQFSILWTEHYWMRHILTHIIQDFEPKVCIESVFIRIFAFLNDQKVFCQFLLFFKAISWAILLANYGKNISNKKGTMRKHYWSLFMKGLVVK